MFTAGTVRTHIVGAPLGAHVVALAVVMLALLPVVGWHGVLSTDEGAAMAQARAVSESGKFGIAHPFAAADQSGAVFPYEKSATADGGFAPLPKKPAYSALLAALYRVGGIPAMFILSLCGALVAATLTALIARQLDPSLGPLTFWLTGLASPLFTDGYLVIAHTIGAACSAGALLSIAVLIRTRRWGRSVLTTALALLLSVSFRAEAALFGLALAIGCASLAWRAKDRMMAAVGAIVLGATSAGVLLDRAAAHRLFGQPTSSVASVPTSDGSGFLGERVRALLITWLRPNYGALGLSALLLTLVLLLGLMAARELRLPRPDLRTVRALAAGTAILACVRLAVPGPTPQLVPGLVVAFPIAAWGVAGLGRSDLHGALERLLVWTGASYTIAVLATQYGIGGGFEWGGRYFALGLPCLTPVAAIGLRRSWRRMDEATARMCATTSVVATVVLSTIGLTALHTNRDQWQDISRAVMAAAATTDPGDGGPPVVITTEPEAPRAAWKQVPEARWLLVPASQMPALMNRLEALEIEELVLLTRGGAITSILARTEYAIERPAATPAAGDWWLITVRRR